MTSGGPPISAALRIMRPILALVAIGGLSACQKVEWRRDYRLSHMDERIAIRFEPAAADPQTAAFMGINTCHRFIVTNEGAKPVTLDVYVAALARKNMFGGLENELKVLVRKSPDPFAPLVAPLGKNVIVTGQWGVQQANIAPSGISYNCADGFVDLSSGKYGLSTTWLDDVTE